MRDWGKFVPTLALLAVGLFAAAPAAAQTGTVTGTILDASTGAPLDAVQVSLETVGAAQTNLGGLTQATGRFILINVPAGQYVLRAQLLGFGTKTQVIDVIGGQPAIVDMRLDPEAISLSEIVVTGVAGATQRTKLPFDVAQVRVADLPVPSVNAAQSIQGKVAGVQVVGSSGRPGTAPSILLRGVTSIDATGRNQDPLYIVDGVILGSSMVDLDALDIQSVEVVKGAAAASLYGSRAGNGVIQIRTKRGAEVADDQVRYTLRTEYGRSELPTPNPLILTEAHEYALTPDGSQFLVADGTGCDWLLCSSPVLAGQKANGGTATAWNTYQTQKWPGQTFDQVERFFTNGDFLQNNIVVEGRSGRTNFHVSASNLQQEGILQFEPGFNRTNFRVNVDQAVLDNLTVQSSVFYSRSKQGTEEGQLFDLTRMPAGVDLLGEDPYEPGEMVLTVNPTDNESPNPLYELKTVDRLSYRSRFLGSATARYSPLEWFKVDGTVSFDRGDVDSETLWPKGYRTPTPSTGYNDGRLYKYGSRTEALNASVTASTVWNVSDQIRNNTSVRYLYESDDFQSFNTTGYEFAVAGVPTLDNTNSDNESASSYLQTVRADGYFLITDFDLYDKYIVNALVRNDGSSLFGEDERRQWYYRMGGAWRISQEDFFNVGFVDDLKFRYSLGTAGGRPSFSAQYETYSVSGGRISPVTLGNKDLKPEFSREQEVGIDVSLFNFKSMLTLTYAQTTTEDQILPVPQPAFTGFQTQWRNAGTLESKTWEATLDLRLVERADLSWSTKLLFDRTRSEITELNVPAFTYGTPQQGNENVFYARAGEKMGTFYGYQAAENCGHLPAGMSCDGFAVNDDGFLVWIGQGGSFDNPQWGTAAPMSIGGKTPSWGTPFAGVCMDRSTGEESLFCEVGNTIPDFNLGFSTTLTYKGVSLYGLLSHSSGFEVFNRGLQWGTFKRMTGIFDQTGVPEAKQKPIGYYDAWYAISGLGSSSIFMEDGTFTKIREIALNYRLPADILSGIPGLNRFDGIGLNLTGRNLYTWHNYRGYDPEMGVSGGDTGSAALARVDGYSYPAMRTFTFTVDFIF
jgi:TonB-linked SusC/RagA family outer membrane protein